MNIAPLCYNLPITSTHLTFFPGDEKLSEARKPHSCFPNHELVNWAYYWFNDHLEHKTGSLPISEAVKQQLYFLASHDMTTQGTIFLNENCRQYGAEPYNFAHLKDEELIDLYVIIYTYCSCSKIETNYQSSLNASKQRKSYRFNTHLENELIEYIVNLVLKESEKISNFLELIESVEKAYNLDLEEIASVLEIKSQDKLRKYLNASKFPFCFSSIFASNDPECNPAIYKEGQRYRIEDIPKDVLAHIFNYELEPTADLARVCKLFDEITKEPTAELERLKLVKPSIVESEVVNEIEKGVDIKWREPVISNIDNDSDKDEAINYNSYKLTKVPPGITINSYEEAPKTFRINGSYMAVAYLDEVKHVNVFIWHVSSKKLVRVFRADLSNQLNQFPWYECIEIGDLLWKADKLEVSIVIGSTAWEDNIDKVLTVRWDSNQKKEN